MTESNGGVFPMFAAVTVTLIVCPGAGFAGVMSIAVMVKSGNWPRAAHVIPTTAAAIASQRIRHPSPGNAEVAIPCEFIPGPHSKPTMNRYNAFRRALMGRFRKRSSEIAVLTPPGKHEVPPLDSHLATQPGEITRVLDDLGRGEDDARDRLLRLVYDEIHRMARAALRGEAPDRTLQATALINEAYLRLLGGPPVQWENRAHFFASAAEVMRRVLID